MSSRNRNRIIDVGDPEDFDGSLDALHCMPATQQHHPCDGPPMDKWLARSYEELPAVDTSLTRLIPPGERRC